MRQSILFLMIFSVNVLFGQLYISPSDKSDTYIYAKDRLIFVQKDIQLSENHKKETLASIYLRKDAQLLQGAKTNNQNSGNGKISIFQKGTSNAYDYNYWGLPVAVKENNQQINDFIFEPLSNTESRNAKLISALDGSSDPLSISRHWIYTFNGNSYSNWQPAGDHFDLNPGEGFTMKGVNGMNLTEIEGRPVNPGASHIYDFRGLPNDGLIGLPVKKDQILLVGNPYPSALHLDRFLMENTSTTGIAYFWDSKRNGNSHYLADYEGGYGVYSPGVGIYVPAIFRKYPTGIETGETGQSITRKISPVAQGFMIIGQKDGKVSFQNSQRVFQKERAGISEFKSSEAGIPSLKLNIELDSTYVRQLVLAFRQDATPDEDHAMDARKIDASPSDVSWSLSDEPFIINVRPKLDEELIPLKISLDKETSLQFSAGEMNNFNPDRLFIYDAQDDLYFGIKTGYLKIKLPKGEYNERFYVSFIEKLPPRISEPAAPEEFTPKPPIILLNTIDIFQNNKEEQLEVKVLYDSGISSLRVYDLNGKLIFNRSFKGIQKDFTVPTGNLGNAVYIVKVNTTDKHELAKKISVRN